MGGFGGDYLEFSDKKIKSNFFCKCVCTLCYNVNIKEDKYMLKNRDERKKYIEDKENWKMIGNMFPVVKIYMLRLPDGTVIYKYEFSEKQINGYVKGDHDVCKYRLLHDGHVSEEVSMTFLVDLLTKIK